MKQVKTSSKWSEEAENPIELDPTSDLAASIAKEIVVHARAGAFLLLYLDGEEMHVYASE